MKKTNLKQNIKGMNFYTNTQNIGNIKNTFAHNRGFVLIFSILISTVILLISSGVYNSVQKQVVLSSYARESQRAFYAADAALECALFNDVSLLLVETAFPVTTTPNYSIDLTCGGGETTARVLEGGIETGGPDFTASYVFRYYGVQSPNNQSGCAYVLIEKKLLLLGQIETRITASGFNTCKEGIRAGALDVPNFDDPTLLERRLSIRYII